jgi:hypothetical protein
MLYGNPFGNAPKLPILEIFAIEPLTFFHFSIIFFVTIWEQFIAFIRLVSRSLCMYSLGQ